MYKHLVIVSSAAPIKVIKSILRSCVSCWIKMSINQIISSIFRYAKVIQGHTRVNEINWTNKTNILDKQAFVRGTHTLLHLPWYSLSVGQWCCEQPPPPPTNIWQSQHIICKCFVVHSSSVRDNDNKNGTIQPMIWCFYFLVNFR